MELVDFLRARLDEAVARAGQWHDLECDVHAHLAAGLMSAVSVSRMLVEVPGAVCDCGVPARVLAEVEAKRRIIARHSPAPLPPGHEYMEEFPYCAAHAFKGRDGTVTYPVELNKCPELRDLARVYRDHPDFDPTWLEG